MRDSVTGLEYTNKQSLTFSFGVYWYGGNTGMLARAMFGSYIEVPQLTWGTPPSYSVRLLEEAENLTLASMTLSYYWNEPWSHSVIVLTDA